MLREGGYGIDIVSKDCEIAIWNESGNWVTGEILEKFDSEIRHDDSVCGYLEFNKWFELMKFVENL